jgi:hypothetical protein
MVMLCDKSRCTIIGEWRVNRKFPSQFLQYIIIEINVFPLYHIY